MILKVLGDLKKDTNKHYSKKINKLLFKKLFLNTKQKLLPNFSYRTAELSSEINTRLNKFNNNEKAHKLINECFLKCTLTTFYYIHLDDLETIINRHKETGEWCVILQ